MSKLDKQLNFLFVITILAAAAVYAYFEFVSPIETSPLAGLSCYADLKYGAEVVCDLLAIGFVYLALRMMVMPKVRKSILGNAERYAFWARLRWGMLALVIALGEIVNYLLDSPSNIWCSVIGCFALLFVWPTPKRREYESQIEVTPVANEPQNPAMDIRGTENQTIDVKGAQNRE